MDEKIGALGVELNAKVGDTSEVEKFTKALDRLDKTLTSLGVAFDFADAALKPFTRSINAFAKAAVKLDGAADKLDKATERMASGIARLSKAQSLGFSGTAITAAFESAAKRRVDALKAVGTAAREAAGDLKASKNLSDLPGRLPKARTGGSGGLAAGGGGVGGSAIIGQLDDSINRVVSRSVLAATAASTALAVASTAVGTNFQATLQRVASIGGLTADQIAAVEVQARQLGKTTQFTATQAADAFVVLAQAGVSVDDSITASNSALALAATLNTSLESSISLLIATQRQFNLTAEDTAAISDVFNKATKTSLLDFEKLREGLKFAGPVGAQFGLSLAEVTATLAGLADLGLTGEQTGTVFRSALAALTRLTGKQQQVLKELKLEYKDINPEANSFVEIIERLAEAGLNASQANALFGTVAAPVGSLVDQERINPGALRGRRASLENPFGETAKQFADVQKTLLFAFQSLKSSVEELLLSLFDSFEEPLRRVLVAFTAVIDAIAQEYARVSGDITDGLGGGIDSFTSKLSSNRVTIARTFVELSKAVANFALFLANVGVEFVRLAPFVKAFGAAVVAAFLAAKVGAFITTIGGIAVAFSGATAATTTFSLAVAASTGGLSLALTAVAALAAAVLTLALNYERAAFNAGRLQDAQIETDSRREALNEEEAARTRVAATNALLDAEEKLAKARARRKSGGKDAVPDEVLSGIEARIERLSEVIEDPSLGQLAIGSGTAAIRSGKDDRQTLFLFAESIAALKRAQEDGNAAFAEFGSDLGASVDQAIIKVQGALEAKTLEIKSFEQQLVRGTEAIERFESANDRFERLAAGAELQVMFSDASGPEGALTRISELGGLIAAARTEAGGLRSTLKQLGNIQWREGLPEPLKAPPNDDGYGRGAASREQAAAASLDALRAALQALRDQAGVAGQDEALKIVAAAQARFEALERIAEKTTASLIEAGKLSAGAVQEVSDALDEGRMLTETIVGQQLDELIEKRSEAARKAVDGIKATLAELTEAGPAGGILRRGAQDVRRLRDGGAAANAAVDERLLAAETLATFKADGKALVAAQEEAAAERLRIEQTVSQGRLDIAKRTLVQLREVTLREAENAARLRDQFAEGAERFLGVGDGTLARRDLARQLAEFGRIEEQIVQQTAAERALIEARLAAQIQSIRENLSVKSKGLTDDALADAQRFADARIRLAQASAKAEAAALEQGVGEGREQRSKEAEQVGRRGKRQANKALRDGIADQVSEGFFQGSTTFAREGLDRLGREIVGRLGQYFTKALTLLGISQENAERFTKELGKGLGKFVGLYVGIIKAATDALRSAADYLRQAFDDVFGVDLSVRGQAVAATGEFTDARARGQLSQAEEMRFGSRQVMRQVDQARTTADAFPGIVNGVIAGFAQGVPTLINAFVGIIPALTTGIIGAFEQIVLKVVDAAPRIAEALAASIPRLVEALIPQIPRIVEALAKSINILLRAVLKALPDVIDGLGDGLAIIIEKVVPKFVVTVAKNIGPILTALVNLVPKLLLAFAKSLPRLIPALILVAQEVLLALIPALAEAAVIILVDVIPALILGIITAFGRVISDFFVRLEDLLLGFFKDLFPDKETRQRRKALRKGEVADEDLTKEDREFLARQKERRRKQLATFGLAEDEEGNLGAKGITPGFSVGSAGIPRDMTARVHEGERILTKAQNALYSAMQRMGSFKAPMMKVPSLDASGVGFPSIGIYLDGRLIDEFQVTSDARGRNGRSKAMANRHAGIKTGRKVRGS